MSQLPSIEKMSFEETLAELEEIVKKIDSGQENLANAVSSFERGVLLKKHCEKLLQDAKLKIEKITESNDKNIEIVKVSL